MTCVTNLRYKHASVMSVVLLIEVPKRDYIRA